MSSSPISDPPGSILNGAPVPALIHQPPRNGVLRSWYGPILCLAAHCLDYAPGRTLRRDDRDLVEPGCPQQLSVLLVGAFLPATEKHQHVEVPQGETRPLGRIGGVLRREYLLDHPQPRAPNCGGHWLDPGELRTIRTEYASEEERERAASEYFSEVFGPQLAAAHAQTEEDLARARRIAHAFRFICPSYYVPGKQDWGAF
jgi:Zn-finger nucleic acid-binding protein